MALFMLSAMLSPIAVNTKTLDKYSIVIFIGIFGILSAGQFQAARSTQYGKVARLIYRFIGVLLFIPIIFLSIGIFIE